MPNDLGPDDFGSAFNAETHPMISQFAEVIKPYFANGAVDFEILQKPQFLKFWRHLMIAKYLPDLDDFRIVFWGTYLVNKYGKELSGKTFAEAGLGDKQQYFYDLHKSAMLGQEIIFTKGIFSWEDKDFLTWYQIKMPLRRSQQVCETLTCIYFEET